MKKLYPGLEALDSVLTTRANLHYEAANDDEQAQFSLNFLRDGLIGLPELVERQRRLERSFESEIMQLVSFEKHKFEQFTRDDALMIEEIEETKAKLKERIAQLEKENEELDAQIKQ